jgi:hypothetical protein
MVVYRATVSVVTLPILAGQSVTVAAQEVTVYIVVVYTVDVVKELTRVALDDGTTTPLAVEVMGCDIVRDVVVVFPEAVEVKENPLPVAEYVGELEED